MTEPRFYEVPKGTPSSTCTGHRKPGGTCRASVFWIETPKIRKGQPVAGQTSRVPVDCSVSGGSEPDSLSAGRGVSHFTTCPDSNHF